MFCRCDGKSDCKDYSDEVGCKVVEVSSSYNKFLTPPIPETAISEKLEILSTVVIQAFGTFDPIESNFAVKFTIKLQWYDKKLVAVRKSWKFTGFKDGYMANIFFQVRGHLN